MGLSFLVSEVRVVAQAWGELEDAAVWAPPVSGLDAAPQTAPRDADWLLLQKRWEVRVDLISL